MTNDELQSLPINTIVVRTSKSGKKSEWIKAGNGRDPWWAWFRRVLKDGTIWPMDSIINAHEIEESK